MTHDDIVIDAISKELRKVYQQNEWSEQTAHQRSHKILKLVEEFQERRTLKPRQWRATD